MPIEVRCPQGHKLKVPDKAAGKTVKCPKCQSACRVPEPVVETEFEELDEFEMADDTPTDDYEDEPLPTPPRGKKGKKKQESSSFERDDTEPSKWLFLGGGAAGGSLLTAVLMYLLMGGSPPPAVTPNPAPVATAPASAPAADKPVAEEKVSAASPVAATPEPPRPMGTPGSAKEEVIQALFNASDMLEKKQYRMLAHEFAPDLLKVMGRGQAEIPEPAAKLLLSHLIAARKGDFIFNPDSTYAEIVYVLRPVELLQNEKADVVIAEDQPLTTPAPGLDGDLPQMLRSAADLLKNGKMEEFVLHVYPEGEISRLQQTDTMKSLMYRLKTVPPMLAAMLRDLELAANAGKASAVSETKATLRIPGTQPDQERTLEFEKVNGHWRFADVNRATRQAVANYSSAVNPPAMVAGERGSLVLQKIEGRWKMTGELSVQPIEAPAAEENR